MKQNISRKPTSLLSAINLAIAGYTKHAAVVILATNTGAALTAARAQAVAARDAHNQGKIDVQGYKNQLLASIKQTREFIMLARDLFQRSLGRKYSTNWLGTGFTRSLEVPYKASELEPMIESLAKYLTDNPAKEAPGSNITAAVASKLYTELLAARTALVGQRAATRTLKETRDAKFATVYKRLSGMVKELSQVLTPLDSRWLDYGFQIPGLQQTPPTPGKVTAVLVGNNALTVGWEAVPRVEYYRIFAKVNGIDQEIKAVGTTDSLSFTIENLPAATEVEVAISAVNNGGESAMSEIFKVTTKS